MQAALFETTSPRSRYMLQILLVLGLLCQLPGCATQTQPGAELPGWPPELPPSRAFRAAWLADTGNQGLQTEDEYLQWVQRFYLGSTLVPGWLDVSKQVLERLTRAEQASISPRLVQLGVRIGTEWAKDNAVRLLHTRMVAVWRDALLEALRREELEDFLSLLERDVSALLAGRLAADAVVFERYYTDEFDL